jgi:hypothetical protein
MKTIEEKIRVAAKKLTAVRISGRTRKASGFVVRATRTDGSEMYRSQVMPKNVALSHLLAVLRTQPHITWRVQ